MNILTLIAIIFPILLPIDCQLSETATTLDVITDGMKSMFGLDQVMKTFKKISTGMIPFPLFVPIVPKSKVLELFRGKKSPKDESLEQISESNAKLQKLPMQIPMPLAAQLMAKINPNYQQYNEQMFYNSRPYPEMLPEMPFMVFDGQSAAQPPIEDDMRPNDLNLDNVFESNNEEDSNAYSERFESGIDGNSHEFLADKSPSAQDVIHNWQIIDEELKKIGQQLGKLGKYLNRN